MTWQRIIVHNSESDDTDEVDTIDIDRWHKEFGWQMIGYNVVIERIGSGPDYHPVGGRPLDMPGAHCRGRNHDSIGVCFVGDFNKYAPPEAQIREGARVIAKFCRKYGIKPDQIRAHSDFANTDCPGQHFPMELLRNLVRRELMRGDPDKDTTRPQ